MVRKILILVCVLGLVWVLYIGVEEDNDHRRPGKIKGVIIPPKKIENTENQPIEPPGTLKAHNKQREIEKEWIECIEKKSRIYIIFKKAYINNKGKQRKVLRYLENTYNLIEATLPEHTKKRNDERGEVIIRFKDVEKYKLGEIEKLEKDVDSYVERLKEDKTLEEYIEKVGSVSASYFVQEYALSPCHYFRFHKKKQENIKQNK